MTPTTAVQKTAKKRVFDLDKFEKVSVERVYTVPADLTDVKQLAVIEPAELLKLVNIAQKREALKAAKASIPGASPKIVNQMVNVFRMVPPYCDIFDEAKPESRKDQTQAIYTFIRSNESILQSLKDAAVRATEEDDDEEDENAA